MARNGGSATTSSSGLYKHMNKLQTIINFVLFQLAWFACVVGASKDLPWLGVIVALAVAAWHISQAIQPKLEMRLILTCLLIGGLYDQAILSSGLVTYVHNGWGNALTALVPAWILGLWLAFATILNASLRWMHGRYITGAVFGAIGGPLAYIGAEKIGAVTLHGNNSYIALSLGWAIITPLLLGIATRYDGFTDLRKEAIS